MSEPLKISDVMTPMPFLVKYGCPISVAEEMIEIKKIHHLPVVKDGEIVGIITKRNLTSALGIQNVKGLQLSVEDVMIPSPYTVEPAANLRQVLDTMAAEHYGCALICAGGTLKGIFTTTDACRLLSSYVGLNEEIL